MSDIDNSAWKKGMIAVGFFAICGLGYYNWHLHNEVQDLKQQISSPAANNMPAADPLFDPWSKQSPQDMFDAMRKQMDKMMNNFTAQSVFPGQNAVQFSAEQPSIALNDDKDAYQVVIDIPKGAEVNLNTELNDHELTLQGSVKNQVKNEHQQFSSVNQFTRSFYLADSVKQSDMKTTQSDNKIIITLPKVG